MRFFRTAFTATTTGRRGVGSFPHTENTKSTEGRISILIKARGREKLLARRSRRPRRGEGELGVFLTQRARSFFIVFGEEKGELPHTEVTKDTEFFCYEILFGRLISFVEVAFR